MITRVKYEQLQQSYAGIPLSMLITLVNAGLFYFLLEPVNQENYALTWFIVISLVTLARLLLYIAFRFTKSIDHTNETWGLLFTIGSLVAGCVWGSTAIFLFPSDSITHQVFIAFMLAGMTAGAVATLSSYWFNAAAFIIPALLPLIFRYFELQTPIANAMGFMVTLYLFILLTSTKRFYQNNLQNITLRHESRKREHTLQQFKATLDQTLDCVFMFYADSLQFFYLNQGALDQVGYTKDELLQMHPYDIKPDYTEEKLRHFLRPLLNEELTSITFETTHQHKDGHRIPVEIFLQYIHPQQEAAHFVAIVRDITERKRLDKIKDEFVSTVSHELRTPMTSLRGSLGLILGGAVGKVDEKQLNLLNIAQQNTERLLLLINDLLDIQKIETSNLDFHFSTIDLAGLIDTAITENQSYADKHDVQIRFTPPGVDCQVHADADRLNQVMNNLLSNAAKFSPPGSAIEVGITASQQHWRVTVHDHGPGIKPEFETRVFDKFTQSDATDQRRHGGTGLGLAICKSIIEKHHGKIGFDTLLGQGTSFYFDLPRISQKTLP